MPDHTTGGIAADPGNPASGPPGETIGGFDEATFSTPEAGKFTSVRAGPAVAPSEILCMSPSLAG